MASLGEMAPDFTLPRDGGGEVSLSGLRPKAVVLYFYPRDDTPGCTKEAVGFTERTGDFAKANCVVVGVSTDTVTKHDKFREKYNLSVILASDADADVCEQYGVWKEKNMYGKTYMGIERSTFLIDSEGKIAGEWRKVKVPGHVDAVLEAAQTL